MAQNSLDRTAAARTRDCCYKLWGYWGLSYALLNNKSTTFKFIPQTDNERVCPFSFHDISFYKIISHCFIFAQVYLQRSQCAAVVNAPLLCQVVRCDAAFIKKTSHVYDTCDLSRGIWNQTVENRHPCSSVETFMSPWRRRGGSGGSAELEVSAPHMVLWILGNEGCRVNKNLCICACARVHTCMCVRVRRGGEKWGNWRRKR